MKRTTKALISAVIQRALSYWKSLPDLWQTVVESNRSQLPPQPSEIIMPFSYWAELENQLDAAKQRAQQLEQSLEYKSQELRQTAAELTLSKAEALRFKTQLEAHLEQARRDEEKFQVIVQAWMELLIHRIFWRHARAADRAFIELILDENAIQLSAEQQAYVKDEQEKLRERERLVSVAKIKAGMAGALGRILPPKKAPAPPEVAT